MIDGLVTVAIYVLILGGCLLGAIALAAAVIWLGDLIDPPDPE